jgi:hypothetical protein
MILIAMYAYEVTMKTDFLFVINAISKFVILTAVTLTEFQMMTGFAVIVRWNKIEDDFRNNKNLERI